MKTKRTLYIMVIFLISVFTNCSHDGYGEPFQTGAGLNYSLKTQLITVPNSMVYGATDISGTIEVEITNTGNANIEAEKIVVMIKMFNYESKILSYDSYTDYVSEYANSLYEYFYVNLESLPNPQSTKIVSIPIDDYDGERFIGACTVLTGIKNFISECDYISR